MQSKAFWIKVAVVKSLYFYCYFEIINDSRWWNDDEKAVESHVDVEKTQGQNLPLAWEGIPETLRLCYVLAGELRTKSHWEVWDRTLEDLSLAESTAGQGLDVNQ